MLLPEPDKPLISTSCISIPYRNRDASAKSGTLPEKTRASIALLDLGPLPFHELGSRMDAAELEDVVAHRGFEKHRQVAAGGDRDHDLANGNPEDVFRLLVQRQALRLARSRAVELHDQAQIHFRAHRGFAEYG